MLDPKALAMSPTNPTAATHTYSGDTEYYRNAQLNFSARK